MALKNIVCPENCRGCDALRKNLLSYDCVEGLTPVAVNCPNNENAQKQKNSRYIIDPKTGLTVLVSNS